MFLYLQWLWNLMFHMTLYIKKYIRKPCIQCVSNSSTIFLRAFCNFCLKDLLSQKISHISISIYTFSYTFKPTNVKITHKLISITMLHRTQTILPIVLTQKLVISTEASRPVGNNKWTSNGGEFLRNVTELRPKLICHRAQVKIDRSVSDT